MPERFQGITRRNLLKGAGATAALATFTPAPNLFAQNNQLEVFSWWAGSEGVALQALFDLYKEKWPDVEIVNAVVAGGAGINAKAVLKTRMLGGDPPDSFQVHAGRELIGTWVVADRLQDLTPMFQDQGWMDAFPDQLIDLISTDEGIWSVPLTIHRSNVNWYNPNTLNDLGFDGPPSSWADFLAMAPEIQDQGVTPLVVAKNWTVQHLWESVALSELGPEKWAALFNGELSFTSSDAVRTWETLNEVLKFTNIDEDASSLSWQQASDRIANGKAAFNVMGDWAAGYMIETLELTPGEEFNWAPSPGTDGNFLMLSDSFPLPTNPPHPENANNWLTLLGSKEGSDVFNPKKGSISPRVDSDLSLYSPYSQSAAEDFRQDTLAGSLVHGIVANENFMSSFANVMSIFLDSRDPQRAANAAQAVAKQTGVA
ncbi:MAG: ABC transporter substrate-binding protein [Candidatus Bipolaricaulia bacterium]